jgi:dihydropteroate synthase
LPLFGKIIKDIIIDVGFGFEAVEQNFPTSAFFRIVSKLNQPVLVGVFERKKSMIWKTLQVHQEKH